MRDPLDPKNLRAAPQESASTAETTRIAACGCNKELPCDTYRRCIAQSKHSRARMLDEGSEGDDLRLAIASQVAAERYDNLTPRCAAPIETMHTMASLVELYDACSEFLVRTATDRQVELYNRVHLLLDWDERREVLRILNGVERFDGDDGARDCFAAHQESGLSINLSVLFCRLCCFDSDYLSRPQDFRRVCLCGNNGTCVNPQHYVAAERRRIVAPCSANTQKKRLRKRNHSELPEEEENAAVAAIVAAEISADAEETERARLAALAVCLDDQLTLQNEASARRLSIPSLQQNHESNKLRQQKEDYFDFIGDAGAKTPTLLSYAEACRSIAAGIEKKQDLERKLPSPTPSSAREEAPPSPALLVSGHCKSMANKVDELLRSRYSLDVII